ncbi:MAG: hypothetical protein ABR881_29260 [Candidatus Sulfotelmatobacter sp.]|jgi:hypothetical protein
MKTLLLATLSMCFCLSVVVALSQEAPTQAPRKTQAAAGDRLTTIMGTVQEGGDKLRFVTDQRVWNVDNPEILEGHEGHYLHATAYVYPDTNSIHITEAKTPTASETKIDDMK